MDRSVGLHLMDRVVVFSIASEEESQGERHGSDAGGEWQRISPPRTGIDAMGRGVLVRTTQTRKKETKERRSRERKRGLGIMEGGGHQWVM